MAGANALAEISAQPNADAQVFAVVVAAEPATAQLPTSWAGDDIGGPAWAGSSSYVDGVFTVNGAGVDIWGGDDQFHFVHQTLTGDGQIIARVTAQENTDPWAKSGVMIKQSATAGAPYALLAVTPSNGIALQSGFNHTIQVPKIAPPNAWLKLTRSGTTITGYTSTNGQTWTPVGSTTVALGSTAEIGLFVTAHNGTQSRWWRPQTRINTSTFDNVSVTEGVNPPPTTLPSWAGDDIGGPAWAGSSSYVDGVFTVNGAGVDIWGGDDQFHFVHQTLTGDGQIIARVTAQENTDPWAKSGVMIKQSATAGAPYALLAVTPSNGIALQSGFNHTIQVPKIAPPNAWLKLTRSGTTITGYTSTNGQTWTPVGSTTVALGSTAEIGLFVTAHNGTQSRWWRPQTRINTSTFDNVSVTEGVNPPSIFFETSPSIGEADGTVLVPIVRTGDLTRPSTIEYGITPDTATAGVDYRGENGTITMDVGKDRVFIPVQILNDNLSESTETFVVSIINVDSGSTILFPRTARVDILDDERPVVDPTRPPLTSNYTVTEQVVASGLNQPLAFEFAPQAPSLMYVAEKGGIIKVFNVNTGTQQSSFIDISSKVNDIQDRGLMDIALHPNFGQPVQPGQPEHNYVYAFYVVDPPGTAGKAGNAGPDGGGNRFAYLVRFRADAATNYTTAVPGSEVILLGGAAQTLEDISGAGAVDSTSNISQPESGFSAQTGKYVDDYVKVDSRSHAGGSLAFGPDGALYVSIGDGASFDTTDPRAVSVQNIDSLSGKILRIDPLTGLGLPDNPFVEPGGDLSANRSKVYQLGLRNPFSIGFAQDGRLFISNTGWFSWEEIESGPPGANFGWPYFEGGDNGVIQPAPGYQHLPSDAARSLSSAAEFYAAVASGTITITPAYRAFAHAENAPGYQLGAIVGVGAPYSGSRYPVEFQNDVFFADINDDEVFVVDVNNRSSVKFLYRAPSASPVAFSQGPDGYVYVANMGTNRITRLLIVPVQV